MRFSEYSMDFDAFFKKNESEQFKYCYQEIIWLFVEKELDHIEFGQQIVEINEYGKIIYYQFDIFSIFF